MNEWLFNDTPAQKNKSANVCQKNGIYIKSKNQICINKTLIDYKQCKELCKMYYKYLN